MTYVAVTGCTSFLHAMSSSTSRRKHEREQLMLGTTLVTAEGVRRALGGVEPGKSTCVDLATSSTPHGDRNGSTPPNRRMLLLAMTVKHTTLPVLTNIRPGNREAAAGAKSTRIVNTRSEASVEFPIASRALVHGLRHARAAVENS